MVEIIVPNIICINVRSHIAINYEIFKTFSIIVFVVNIQRWNPKEFYLLLNKNNLFYSNTYRKFKFKT